MIKEAMCENTINPVGIDVTRPVFSWKYQLPDESFFQINYRIVVYEGDMVCWDSGEVESRENLGIEYDGINLRSLTKYYWDLETTDDKGNLHESRKNIFFTAYLEDDMDIKWICHPGESDNPVFYGDFYVKDELDYCLCVISGLGYYDLAVNGKKATQYLNMPGWTDYGPRNLENLLYPYIDHSGKRVLYNLHDITALLARGLNRFEAMLGNGFFNQIERAIEGDMSYGNPRLFMEITMIYKDGSRDVFKADESIFCTEGPLEFNNIYFGEIRNDNLGSSFDGSMHPVLLEWEHGTMISQFNSFDCIAGEVTPIEISDGIYDTGRNMSGRVRVSAKGPRGAQFTLRYFESMVDGKPDYGPSGGEWQIQESKYIFGENKEVNYHETFGFRGFRYFSLEKDDDVVILDIKAEEIYGAQKGENYFDCADETVQWIYDAYVRTQLSNMHGGVPSDCPHRERLGYTGDGQVTCDSALLSIDSQAFYRKWLDDILISQDTESGFVPHTVPFSGGGGGPAWGSACAIVPWVLYNHTFDPRILKEAYPVICKWIGYLENKNPDLIVRREEEGSWCLGDWCLPVGGYEVEEVDLDRIFEAMDPALVNTCYFYKCITICIDIGKIIGRSTVHFERLAGRVRERFNEEFLDRERMTYGSGEYCSNVYPLGFGMVPDQYKKQVAGSLNDYIVEKNYAMMLGIFGVSLIFGVLSEYGYTDTIKRMLAATDYPSFGYMKSRGATTIWETWDGRASGNHPMFGSVTEYLIRHLAGIRYFNKEGQYLFEPQLESGYGHMAAGVSTVHGMVEIGWEKTGDDYRITIKLPGNTRGVLKAFGQTMVLQNGKTNLTVDPSGKLV